MSEVLLEVDQVLDENETNLRRICKHICEKKKRQCKFSALKNCDYCVEHLAFNKEVIILVLSSIFFLIIL